MGQFLSQPLTDKTVEYKELPKFSYCLGSMQGYRLTQEDAHSIKFHPNLSFKGIKNDISSIDMKIFGIYDGHGGSQSSNYLASNLSNSIINEFNNNNNNSNNNKTFKTNQGLINYKFKNAFFKTDYELYKKFQKKNLLNNSGSTAIVGVIINNKELYCLNTGDSRLIISINGFAKNLSFDHKPNHIGELIRINDAGGSVNFNRVGGILALSRAFGDFNFKLRNFKKFKLNFNEKNKELADNNKLVSEETQVTVEPEIIHHNFTINDEFIIIACDGIWDVFKNQDLIQYIRNHLVLDLKLNDIITKLLEYTLTLANQTTGVGFDNMSIIIIACQYDDESLTQWYQRMKLKIEIEKGII